MYLMYLQVRYGIGASMYVNTCVLRVYYVCITCVLRVYYVCTHAAVSCVSCLCAYAALQIRVSMLCELCDFVENF